MVAPSAANPGFGLQTWRARPFVARRLYSPTRPDIASVAGRPIGDEAAYFLDGWGQRRLWVLPGARTVVLRLGTGTGDWDDTRIPNLVLQSLAAGPGSQVKRSN
jgi:hypothetical protein